MHIEQLIKEAVREVIREEIQLALQSIRLQGQNNKIMRATEAAAYLNIAKTRLYELAQHPNFPVVRDGRKLLFQQKDLDAWLERQKTSEVI